MVSTEPKEQLSFEKHSKEILKTKELGKKLNNMGTHKLIHKTTFGSSSEANYRKNREIQVTKCGIGTPTTSVPIVQKLWGAESRSGQLYKNWGGQRRQTKKN